mmetsp:Transcript_10946/g.46731  ORF Transcript_10946/g.46731 Transcript_10946/m.46731 type:complete len:262 (+) Transcript_10946:3143-3928(+)
MEQLEQHVLDAQALELLGHARVLLRLLLLLLHLLALRGERLALGKGGVLVLLRLVPRLHRLLVVLLDILRAADLLDERGQVLRALRRHALDVALEHEEVARLHQDAVRLEPLVVRLGGARAPVHAVLARARGGDVPREDRLHAVLRLVHQLDVRRAALLFVREVERVHQVAKRRAAQLRGLHAQHERDGIHQVGLAAAVRADDGRELLERTDHLVALVRLEVLALQAGDHPFPDRHRALSGGRGDHRGFSRARRGCQQRGK